MAQRNREAIESKLSYPEFLALLITDEGARSDQKKYTHHLSKAGFKGDKTLAGVDFDFNLGIDQRQVSDLADRRFIEEKVAVLIAGPCGTGNSHIAQALSRCAVRKRYEVLFTTQSQLGGQIHAARATGTIGSKLQPQTRVPLLMIDDFGLKLIKPVQDGDFHALIAERYESVSTIVTSNLDFNEWGEALPNKLLSASTLDRLRHGSHQLVLDGKSYRSPWPLKQEQDHQFQRSPKPRNNRSA